MPWTKPRQTMIEVAVTIINRGYDDTAARLDICRQLVERHYHGNLHGKATATGHLKRSVLAALTEQYYEKLGRAIAELTQMEDALTAEGWRFIPAYNGGSGGFWRHELGEVNMNGGVFHSFELATQQAYYSATRQWLLTGGGKRNV